MCRMAEEIGMGLISHSWWRSVTRRTILVTTALALVGLGLIVIQAPVAVADQAKAADTSAPSTDPLCGLCVLSPTGTSLADTGNGLLTVAARGIAVDSAAKPALSVTGHGSISASVVNVVGTALLGGQGT